MTTAVKNTKLTSARAFIRSLNILLKYARLYSFDHARTAEQFDTAWNELHDAIPITNESGLLLSATGAQLLLDGAPIDATPAERSFAQLLNAAGLASIQFTARVTKEDLERLVRAFPSQNTKPSVLAEQLKAALAHAPGIRINEIRYVAEDPSRGESFAAGLLTAQTLGADVSSLKDWLRDPQKLLQLIAAAEGSRTGPGDWQGNGAGGEGPGATSEPGNGGATEGAGQGTAGTGIGVAGSGTGTSLASGAVGGGTPGGNGTGGSGIGGAMGNTGTETSGLASGPTGSLPYGTGTPGRRTSGGASGGTSTGASGKTSGGGGYSSSGPVIRGAPGPGGPNRTGSGFSPWSTKDEDILGILKLLTHLGHAVSNEGEGIPPGPLQEELTRLPVQSQEMLRQALSAVAAQTPVTDAKDPMLLRLAEHLAVRFALERYERGEVKVNAVRQMIERMAREIEGLRKILGVHEQKFADAGIVVESHTDLLDRQFWAAVPEKGKRAVLTSTDSWCVPARNLRQYVEELIQRGDEKLALEILQNYAASIQSAEYEARRRTAIGLADIADLYSSFGGKPLSPAIQIVGGQLSLERDDNLQGLISAAFVRLAQEAVLRRMFSAVLQALDSLDAVENQRPVFAQNLRPRIGLEKRISEYLDEIMRGERGVEGLDVLLQRVPRAAAENLVQRFNRTGNRAEMQRLADLARSVGNDVASSLRDTLRTGSSNDAAETVGLLSRLDSPCLERWLPERLTAWPRNAQDRMVRLLAMGGSPDRGNLLTSMLHLLDPVLLSLTIDEIGLSEDASCVPTLMRLAEGDMARSAGGFAQLKAVEALGRLKAQEAAELLRGIAEARHIFHWAYPAELRLAALQSLAKIDSIWTGEFLPRSGFGALDLSLAPLDPLPNANYFRRRRYPRIRLSNLIPAIVTAGQASYRLDVRGLSLSGGVAVGEKHMQPGTLVSMKLGSVLRPIRVRVLMRDARAQGLGFEFADMDLDERGRLRRLLLENRSSTISSEQSLTAQVN